MRRPFTISTCALVLALCSAPVFAQDPPAQPPAQAPAAPKLTFTTDAGILLVQIKGDQTAAFEELVSRLRAGATKATDASVKQLLTGMKVYKTAEGAGGGNALYVVIFDPAAKNAEHELFQLVQKVMTPEELRAPETAEFFKKATGAFVTGYNKLSLTPVGGGM